MNYLNLDVASLSSEEFLGSEPVDRATWLCLLKFCVTQENGGRIVAATEWGERKWMQLCGVEKAETRRSCKLWRWEGSDLIVWAYPLEQETIVKAKREAGKKGGSAKSEVKTEASRQNGQDGGRPKTQAETQAESPENPSKTQALSGNNPSKNPTKGKGKEGNEKERNTNGAGAPDAFEVFWSAYPTCERKKNRHKAQIAFDRQKAADAMDRVLLALQGDSASLQWRRERGQYIPAPAVWLNSRRWDDLLPIRVVELPPAVKATDGWEEWYAQAHPGKNLPPTFELMDPDWQQDFHAWKGAQAS